MKPYAIAETDEPLIQVQRIARVSESDFFRPFDPSFADLLHENPIRTVRPAGKRFERLLVAVDLSDCSRAALDYALSLGVGIGARAIIVLHVLGPESMRQCIKRRYPFTPRTTEGPALLDDSELINLVAEEREKSYATLQCFVPVVSASQRVQLQVLIGDPVERIVEAAEQARADLLIMGTHGRTGLQRVVMGSVAEQVLRAASCAVLAVKEG